MARPFAVSIEGLKEFRAAVRAAAQATPSAVTRAIKAAGDPLLKRTQELVRPARKSGRLERGYAVRASGAAGRVVNREAHSAGAEFGFGGKWKGFNKYGPRQRRFAWRALDEERVREEMADVLFKEMREIADVYGWFQEI